MSTLTLQQKLYIAAGANVVFVVSLFLKWFGPASGFDSLPSAWILLLFAAGAAALLFAQASGYDLPVRVPPFATAAYLSSVPLIVSVMFFLEIDGGREAGMFLGLLASGAATAFATLIWREEG